MLLLTAATDVDAAQAGRMLSRRSVQDRESATTHARRSETARYGHIKPPGAKSTSTSRPAVFILTL
ncbi:MAG TPA: hypothetical protein VK388_03495 [Pyrinomonadaceae bacterium]|nr:hypothetical protein [Pyrinomonadaceae bacterium]